MDLYNLVLSAKITKGEGGGGDEPTGTKEINITQNGVTTENVKSYASAKITTNVPNSYAAGDEGKVVSNGALVAQTSKNVTSNGTVDTTTNNQVVVNVPSDTPTIQSLSVTQNGTYSVPSGVDGYNPITVNVSGGGGGGDHDAEDGIIDRTISGVYENSRVTQIGAFALASCSKLTTASFPNATSIDACAFSACTSLVSIYFPSVTFISNNAFQTCSKLASANFPNVMTISGAAFQNCYDLSTISFPNVKSISGTNAFANCSKLTYVSLPNALTLAQTAFVSCTSLATVSLDNVTSIGNQCFKSCMKLESVYILASSVPTMTGSAVFASTPMSLSSYLGHFGSIYVPASLVDSYKSASSWSYYADRITSYEG